MWCGSFWMFDTWGKNTCNVKTRHPTPELVLSAVEFNYSLHSEVFLFSTRVKFRIIIWSSLTSAMNLSMSSFLWKTNARRSWNEMWFSTYLAKRWSFTLIWGLSRIQKASHTNYWLLSKELTSFSDVKVVNTPEWTFQVFCENHWLKNFSLFQWYKVKKWIPALSID